MADKISGYGRNGPDVVQARTRTSVGGPRDADGDGDRTEAGGRTESGGTTTQVRLTDSAARLKQAETRLADLPDVDRARVEAVRQRVESGAYQVNAGRLADRLLAFERDRA